MIRMSAWLDAQLAVVMRAKSCCVCPLGHTYVRVPTVCAHACVCVCVTSTCSFCVSMLSSSTPVYKRMHAFMCVSACV